MKYSSELKNQILEEVKSTGNISAVAKKNKLPCSTVHTWLRKIKEQAEDVETSNSRAKIKELKKELADKDLQINIMKDLLKKTYQVWQTD